MRKQKKVERAVKGLEAMLAKLGVDQAVIEEAAKTVPVTPHDLSMHAEAVLLSLQQPSHFMMKKCKYCQEEFGTNYRSVGYCSDAHRAKALRQMGIEWNPHKTAEERWGGEPPLVIPPEAYRKLVKFAEILLAQREIVESQHQETPSESRGISVPEPKNSTWALNTVETHSVVVQESLQQTSETRTTLGIVLPELDDLLG